MKLYIVAALVVLLSGKKQHLSFVYIYYPYCFSLGFCRQTNFTRFTLFESGQLFCQSMSSMFIKIFDIYLFCYLLTNNPSSLNALHILTLSARKLYNKVSSTFHYFFASSANYCGGCNAIWSVGGRRVDCTCQKINQIKIIH